MSYNGINLKPLEKAMDRAGMHLGCLLGIHDFNKINVCKRCGFVGGKRKYVQ